MKIFSKLSTQTPAAGSARGCSRGPWGAVRAAFTLVEIMVVMALLSVIVLGLMAMFSQTQKAFRTGMAQTDTLEAGRMFTSLLLRDLQQITPSQQSNGLNFYVQIPNYAPLQQILPASSIPRTNILEDVFFVSRYNQTWNGIGYFVRTNASVGGIVNLAGTLYRYETNFPLAQFNGSPSLAYQSFLVASNPPSINISKVLDGVVEFRIRAYDPTNQWITGGQTNIGADNFPTYGEVNRLTFSNNAVPAYLEVELGVLEPAVLTRFNAIPDPIARSNFLANHAGNVQLFRSRITVRNADPSAYQQ